MSMEKIIHGDLCEAVIGAGMKILNTLKPGLSEKAYENALVLNSQTVDITSSNKDGSTFCTKVTR